jgi:hypothetical protein
MATVTLFSIVAKHTVEPIFERRPVYLMPESSLVNWQKEQNPTILRNKRKNKEKDFFPPSHILCQ